MTQSKINLKRTLTCLAMVILSLAACAPSQPAASPVPTPVAVSTPAPPPSPPPPADIDREDRTMFLQGLIASEQAVVDELPDASLYHIDLQIPNDLLILQGHEEVRYTNRENEPLNEVYFRLFPNVAGGDAAISAVRVDGQEVEPIYELQNSAARVPLAAPLLPGEQLLIEMDFEVEVPREMGGNYGLFGYFDDVLVLDEFYPVIPVYDDEGWNVEVPPPNGDVTYFDISFYVVRVTAPAGLTIVASGVEIAQERADDIQVLTFASGPVRDFYLAASEHYTVVSEQVGETMVNSYAFPERAEGAQLALRHAADALQGYSARFGTYPYSEFDVVSTPMQALGMEYPGIVGIGLSLYDPDEVILGLPSPIILESAIAHEVAHQWFYNVVGNDQVDEPWLDEAVVQYATALYYLDVGGEAAEQGFVESFYGRWDRVERAEIPIGMSTGEYTGPEYGAIVYGRGPLFIAALAEKMGQGTFDEFLRDYYQSNEWGIGTADEFKQLAEQHCQCDLTPLFEEWVYEK